MKVVDLFAGCGGLSRGFQDAGFEVAAAFDNWAPAIEVYRANFDHIVFETDLSNVESSVRSIRPFNPDLIIGGPPCQDFSHAGKRSEGQRADLTVAFANIVCAVRPTWFLMENVDRARASSAFRDAQEVFRAAGYGLTVRVLDASFCGVPQRRKRLICVGKLEEEDDFLAGLIDSRMSRRPMTVKDYMGDELDTDHYYRHPRNYARRAIYSVNEPAATIRGVNRPIPSGYKRHAGDAVGPKMARPLTTEERSRIQTFPKGFLWLGTKTDREQMLGNAVPVKLAEFVATCISEYSGAICVGVNLRLPLQSPVEASRDGNGSVQSMVGQIGRSG